MIRIYKQDNNGNVSIVTNCTDANIFRIELSMAIEAYIENLGDQYGDYEHDFNWILSNGFEILLKLKGYKNEGVSEQRMLFAGDHWPTPDEMPDAEVK